MPTGATYGLTSLNENETRVSELVAVDTTQIFKNE